VFVAKDVPAFGSKRYTSQKGDRTCPGSVKAEGNTLSSDLLSLTIDPKTGAIASLRRAGVAEDFVDTAKGPGLNDYLYILGRDGDKGRANISGEVKVFVEDPGPIVGTLRIESDAPGCKQLVRRVRIVDGLDYVELTDDVKKMRVRAPEGVYFGFPFNIPNAQIRIDTPFAVSRVEKDQLEGANRNFYCVQRWVDVSNAERGVTWVTLDAPMLQLDPIKIARPFGLEYWREHVEPTAHFYSWTMNNHWETNYKADQEGWIQFRYAIRPHKGDYDAVREQRFGREICQTMGTIHANPATPVPAPMLTVSDPGIIVTSVRPSRDGKAFIVRLFNTTEDSRTVSLNWGKPMGAAWISNPMEDALSQAPAAIPMAKYEMVTLRVER
jgi:hypothetical protein